MDRSSRIFQTETRGKSELIVQILGVLLMALALLMAVSLISHSPEDPPNSSRPPELAQNLAGWIGAQLSYYLLFFVGYGAYVVTIVAFLWGWNRFRLASTLRLAGHTATLLAVMVIYCGATGVPSRGRTYAAFRLGGWLGVSLSSTLLVPYLGRVGSYILLGTLLLVVLMIATSIPFSRIPEAIARSAAWIWRTAGWLLGGIRSVLAACRRRLKRREKEQEMGSRDAGVDEPVQDVQEEIGEGPEYEEEADPIEMEKEVPPVAPPTISTDPFEITPKAPRPAPVRPPVVRKAGEGAVYRIPDLDLLDDAPDEDLGPDREALLDGAQTLERSLASFGIEGRVTQVNPGPIITCFEVEPPPGVKVNRIVNLSDDLALVTKARSIRIQAPIPGKAAVGIEVPNPEPAIVYLKDILSSKAFRAGSSGLMLALGKTASGEPYCTDLTRMPHLLIAGATGAGKSVCINSLVSSILFRRTPKEVRFIMVDPKMLELSVYDDIPHLLAPVVTDPKRASDALKWVVGEMEDRYRTLAQYGVRNIVDFNRKLERMRSDAETDEDREEVPEALPYIVVVIDELADLMMTAPADIEDSLTRVAQMARAVGIHLILATQRPSVNVITGTIKANFPSRIAFRVATKVDSRTILDANGAEKLLGLGDMLFMPSGRPDLIRVHGAFISTEETERIVDWVSSQSVEVENIDLGLSGGEFTIPEPGRDERFEEALRMVVTHQQGSASLLQRRMKVGYARAARLIDELEDAGIVGPSDGSSKARDVLVDESYLLHMDRQDDEEVG